MTNVTLTVEVKTDTVRELTTWKVEDPIGGLDSVKRKLHDLADELSGKTRLDLDDAGNA